MEGLDGLYAGAALSGAVQRGLHEYKYRPRPELAAPLARIAQRAVAGECPHDVLVPVPPHRRRVAERGFDHARGLAVALARAQSRRCWDALERVRDTPVQVGLGAAERERNVQGAFCWRATRPVPARVLLVDDVATTGSTLRACAAAVRAAGGEEVRGVVVARANTGL